VVAGVRCHEIIMNFRIRYKLDQKIGTKNPSSRIEKRGFDVYRIGTNQPLEVIEKNMIESESRKGNNCCHIMV
jgi:hypothetical protein